MKYVFRTSPFHVSAYNRSGSPSIKAAQISELIRIPSDWDLKELSFLPWEKSDSRARESLGSEMLYFTGRTTQLSTPLSLHNSHVSSFIFHQLINQVTDRYVNDSKSKFLLLHAPKRRIFLVTDISLNQDHAVNKARQLRVNGIGLYILLSDSFKDGFGPEGRSLWEILVDGCRLSTHNTPHLNDDRSHQLFID